MIFVADYWIVGFAVSAFAAATAALMLKVVGSDGGDV